LWNLDLPFNKPLWTASYILYTAGLGCIVLGLLYFVIDVKGWKRWSFPLLVLGMNAILAYVLPIAVKIYIFQGWTLPASGGSALSLQQTALKSLTAWAGSMYGGWLYTCGYILFWWLIILMFYKKKIFLRV
jgi:predicted acyltransferase